jgi:hypothetical protein
MEPFVVECPHCKEFILIQELNSCIFRHGIFKDTGYQINSHSNKYLCDYYVSSGKIYGCGKPFQIILDTTGKFEKVVICDYI